MEIYRIKIYKISVNNLTYWPVLFELEGMWNRIIIFALQPENTSFVSTKNDN